jgi:hypothetical protein
MKGKNWVLQEKEKQELSIVGDTWFYPPGLNILFFTFLFPFWFPDGLTLKCFVKLIEQLKEP